MIRQNIERQLEKLYDTREKLLTSINGAAETQEVQSYSISDADGSQSTTRRDMKSLMESYRAVNAEIERLENKLLRLGGSITIFNTRRHA